MNKLPRICLILFILFCVPSCKDGVFLPFLEYFDYFMFHNDSNYPILLLYDYDTSDNRPSIIEGRYLPSFCYEHEVMEQGRDVHDSWEKYVKDSLHLYVLKDTFFLKESFYIDNPKYKKSSLKDIFEDFISDDYIKENLMARMTLKLDDIYPTTYPPKEIHFPPENDSYYNTIYYNGY